MATYVPGGADLIDIVAGGLETNEIVGASSK